MDNSVGSGGVSGQGVHVRHSEDNELSDVYNMDDREESRPALRLKQYFKFTNVSIRVPHSERCLIRGLSFAVDREDRLLIAGESGSAKTSIVRVLRGLWRESEGRVDRYLPFDEPKVVLFLPQKPLLLTTGSLLEVSI
jgi:ABC-type uncharacterized transport system fused permease/ATPase subunit